MLLRPLLEPVNRIILSIRQMPKPVLAVINGSVGGAGMSLALACDLRLCSSKAKFKQAYTSLGLAPDAGWSLWVGLLAGFAACNFRLNEFTGAVLKGQVQKLDTICTALRANAKKVREGIADLPGLKMRKSADVDGDLGSVIFFDWGTRERRDRFLRAIRAEGISAGGPGGSVILPADGRIASKATIHPDWPSFNSPQGKAIQYGAESCPRTIDIIGRFGGVMMGPRYDDEDVKDIIRAIRKVYPAMGPA